ncbi:hypothetical protein CHKEEEPN_4610 [Methylorubrum podarium]|nr:hypothetical protein CHKEEEPN_4610 [Methylorubrum podarium]
MSGRIAVLLTLDGLLCPSCKVRRSLLSHSEVMLGRSDPNRLGLQIRVEVPRIAAHPGGSELHDGVHGVEQGSVVADHDCPPAPVPQSCAHGGPPFAIQVVGRFVEQQEIRSCKHRRRECRASALPAGEATQTCRGAHRYTHPVQGLREALLQSPVGLGELVGRGSTDLGATQQCQLGGRTEEIGNRLGRRDARELAQQRHRTLDDDAAACRPQAAGHEVQECALPGAVPADDASSLLREAGADVGEDGAPVRRGPRDVQKGEMRWHALRDPWRQGGSALRSGTVSSASRLHPAALQ